jgi:hypothetical protein
MGLEAARLKKLEENMASSGWEFEPGQSPSGLVRFWLYSINPVSGVRVAAQLTAEMYREMQSNSGVFRQLKERSTPANEMLKEAIDEFKVDDSHNDKQPFLYVLANFATCTQTWAQLEPLSEVEGIHMIITDWVSSTGTFWLRPIAMYSDKPLTQEEIAECVAAQLKMQKARSPGQMPHGFE